MALTLIMLKERKVLCYMFPETIYHDSCLQFIIISFLRLNFIDAFLAAQQHSISTGISGVHSFLSFIVTVLMLETLHSGCSVQES